jgi:ABC-type transport system involved in multi-copper enzyme maturation permease subunit
LARPKYGCEPASPLAHHSAEHHLHSQSHQIFLTIKRHPEHLWALTDNLRQTNPAEGAALVLVAILSAYASRSAGPAVPIGPGGEAVTDAYMFVHQALVGDGTLTVRVASLSGAHTSVANASAGAFGPSSKGQLESRLHPGLAPWAKAGIILEPDTTQGTAYAAVMVTGSHGVQMQYNYTHGLPGLASPVGPSSSRWLRLTRVGDVITSYDSTDDVHWIEIGTARLGGLPHTVQIGLFVTSPLYFASTTSTGTPSVATAYFDHVSVQGDLPRHSWSGDAITDVTSARSASTWHQLSAYSFTITGSGDIAPLVGGEGVATHWSGASIVNGTIVGFLIVIVLASLFVTSEYRRGLIRTTLVASPRRGRVLAAKAVVAGSLTFAAGAVATAIAEVITRHVFAANGNYLFPQSGPDLARVVIGTGLFLALPAALVVALGTMLRRSAGAVVAGLVLLVLPGILATATSLPAGADDWLMRVTPTAAFAIQATLPRSNLVTAAYTPANGYFPISPWLGLAVLAAHTAVALGGATWFLRRDA